MCLCVRVRACVRVCGICVCVFCVSVCVCVYVGFSLMAVHVNISYLGSAGVKSQHMEEEKVCCPFKMVAVRLKHRLAKTLPVVQKNRRHRRSEGLMSEPLHTPEMMNSHRNPLLN